MASVGNPHYYFLLRSNEVMAKCQVTGAEGRWDEVVKLTSSLADEAEDAAIRYPDIKPSALMSRMASINVEVSQAAGLGDIGQAENACARLQAKALEALTLAEDRACPLSLLANTSLIAVAQFRWQLAMDSYDFRGALEQLATVKPIIREFSSESVWQDPRFASTVGMYLTGFYTSWDLSMISAEVLLDRRRPTRARAKAYATLRKNATRLEQYAEAMKSPHLARQARATRARTLSIEKADQVQGKDWGRYGGILSLLSFCIYVTVGVGRREAE